MSDLLLLTANLHIGIGTYVVQPTLKGMELKANERNFIFRKERVAYINEVYDGEERGTNNKLFASSAPSPSAIHLNACIEKFRLSLSVYEHGWMFSCN